MVASVIFTKPGHQTLQPSGAQKIQLFIAHIPLPIRHPKHVSTLGIHSKELINNSTLLTLNRKRPLIFAMFNPCVKVWASMCFMCFYKLADASELHPAKFYDLCHYTKRRMCIF